MAYGVTPEGFVLKRFEKLREELIDSLVNKYGNIRTDSESKFGMLADIIASKHADLWALAQDVFNSRSITAEGIALDDIVYWAGLERLSATKSGLYVVLYGDDGTFIPPGTIIRCNNTGNQFESVDSWLIQTNSVGACDIEITFAELETFTINIDSDSFSYESESGGDAETVAAELVSAINDETTGSSVMYAVDNEDGTFSLVSKDFSNASISVDLITANLTMSKLGTAIPFTAQEYGPVSAPVGDATVIVTPVTGLDECYNFEVATLGRNEETDSELRARFLQTRSSYGYSTVDAIRNRILQEVDNVVDAIVYENSTDETDSDGLPPHSIMAVVDCPTTTEQAVADKIWQVKAGGILTHGDYSKTVSDSQGNTHTVKYSKITKKYVHVNIVVTDSDETAFPADGLIQIKNAILAFGETLKLGNDLVYQSFYRPIYSIQGIASVSLGIAVTDSVEDTPSYQTSSISIDKTAKPLFDSSRIHVSLA